MEGRREGRNNRKEYYSTSKARKVRLKIVTSYYNILKVFQVLTFSILGHYSFPFYKQMEGAPRLSYRITRVHSLYPIFRPFPLPRASVTLLYPTKSIKANTLLLNIVTRPYLIHLSEERVPVGRVLTWKERYPAPCLPSEGRLTRGTYS